MAVADSYQRYVTESNFQISASGVILVPLQLLHRLIHWLCEIGMVNVWVEITPNETLIKAQYALLAWSYFLPNGKFKEEITLH